MQRGLLLFYQNPTARGARSLTACNTPLCPLHRVRYSNCMSPEDRRRKWEAENAEKHRAQTRERVRAHRQRERNEMARPNPETPTIMASSYGGTAESAMNLMSTTTSADTWTTTDNLNNLNLVYNAGGFKLDGLRSPRRQIVVPGPWDDEENEDMARRFVQVFIIDSDESVPLADAVLYQGEPFLTESTNEELFFEIDIKERLDAHNKKRVTLYKKGKSHKPENKLEAARIRDLAMVVVDIATFN